MLSLKTILLTRLKYLYPLLNKNRKLLLLFINRYHYLIAPLRSYTNVVALQAKNINIMQV